MDIHFYMNEYFVLETNMQFSAVVCLHDIENLYLVYLYNIKILSYTYVNCEFVAHILIALL